MSSVLGKVQKCYLLRIKSQLIKLICSYNSVLRICQYESAIEFGLTKSHFLEEVIGKTRTPDLTRSLFCIFIFFLEFNSSI